MYVATYIGYYIQRTDSSLYVRNEIPRERSQLNLLDKSQLLPSEVYLTFTTCHLLKKKPVSEFKIEFQIFQMLNSNQKFYHIR